jgi:hypothetical protein
VKAWCGGVTSIEKFSLASGMKSIVLPDTGPPEMLGQEYRKCEQADARRARPSSSRGSALSSIRLFERHRMV